MISMSMNKTKFTIGVIISTYNNPRWLEKTLWGYLYQTYMPDEIIIADDGSTNTTSEMIARYAGELPLKHIWHEDKGFRKTEILNKAVMESTADYLIFTDQDLIPRADFVQTHYENAERGYFLSGGAIMLSKELSERIQIEDIRAQNAFSSQWLCENGLKHSWKLMKLHQSHWLTSLLNHITPTKATWNGGNASTWRDTIITANGFDERMKYGGEDREFGERLFHAGIRSKQLRYSLPLLHLYHTRPYRNENDLLVNQRIRKETKKEHRTKTPYGINSL